jgi:hypothetical protein
MLNLWAAARPAGNDRATVTPAEAAQSTKQSNDFLRMLKELKTSMTVDAKASAQFAPLSEEESMLKVSPRR